MQQPASLPNETNEESLYYSNDKEKYQYSSNDNATINHKHHNPFSINNTQAHSYHAHDNASDEFTLPTTHNYDTKNIPISNNADRNSGCLHATMRLPNNNNSQISLTTAVEQLSSTIAVEQRSARKQPCTRWN